VEALSIVGGVNVSLVAGKDFACPGDRVGYADARWLWTRPKFQVSRAIVVSNTISMMYRLLWQQVTAEHLFHYEDVLEDIVPLSSPWVTRHPDHDISSLVASAPASPPAV
jgi:hypothetical protein